MTWVRCEPVLIATLIIVSVGCGDGERGEPQLPADFAVVLERGICFGSCPIYKVAVDASGTVRYDGDRFVRVNDVRDGHVSKAELRRLIDVIEETDFLGLKDEYRSGGAGCPRYVLDAPSVSISVSLAGAENQLVHDHGCDGDPVLDKLSELELEIDQTLATSQWVFCRPQDSFLQTSCPLFQANSTVGHL